MGVQGPGGELTTLNLQAESLLTACNKAWYYKTVDTCIFCCLHIVIMSAADIQLSARIFYQGANPVNPDQTALKGVV